MGKDNKPGYVAVFRKIQDHWIWDDPEMFHAWMDILISAQFHESKKYVNGKVITVPRGSWFISQKTLETRWGWSKNRVRHFLRTLSDDGMVTSKGTPDGTIITVVNYEVYQNPGTAKGTPKGTAEGTTEGTPKGKTEGTHTNHIYQGDQVKQEKKTSTASILRKCTFEEDEIERNIDLCSNGKSPFPNIDIENEYFRIAMAKREERERNG